MKTRIIFFLILITILCFCTDDENILDRPYPLVETTAVSGITSSGAIFNGSIVKTNGSEIIDHGFVWGKDEKLFVSKSEKVSLGSIIGNVFNTTITTTLKEGDTYYVKAYIQTSQFTIYGNIVSFISLGSKAPIINDFNPKQGRIQDTINISGKGFSYINTNNKVLFGSFNAKIISTTDTLLKVEVPDNLNLAKCRISVSVIGNITTSKDDFELIGPEITGVSKTDLKSCDTLVISGNYFSINPTLIKVFLDQEQCNIIKLKENEIRVIIPTFQSTTEQVALKIISSNVESIYNQPLRYLRPLFFGLVARVNTTYNDTLTVTAENLPLCNTNGISVKFGNVPATIIEVTDRLISFKVPESLLTLNQSLTITYEGTTLTYSTAINLSPPEVTSINPSVGTFLDIITITGKNFHPNKARNRASIGGIDSEIQSASPTKIIAKVSVKAYFSFKDVIVKVDQISAGLINTFNLRKPELNSISPSTLSSPGTLTINGNYFNPQADLNNIEGIHDFYRIPETATSQNLTFYASKEIISSGDPYLTSSSTKSVYITTGGQTSNNVEQVTFNYNGPWTKKANFPGTVRLYPITFSVSNKLYVGLGESTNMSEKFKDIWEYDPSANSWTQKSNFPGAGRSEAISFVINNKVYVGFGNGSQSKLRDFWEYTPETDQWIQLRDFPGVARRSPEAFFINGLAYIVGGVGNDNLSDMWSYNPQTDSWEQLADAPWSLLYQNHFILNSKVYHVTYSSPFKLYEFNPITREWVHKLTQSLNIHPRAIGGGYVHDFIGGFLKYNPTNNSFSSLISRAIDSHRYLGQGIEVMNKQYIFGGYRLSSSGASYHKDLWEFDYSNYPD